jgi:hypothetical protein
MLVEYKDDIDVVDSFDRLCSCSRFRLARFTSHTNTSIEIKIKVKPAIPIAIRIIIGSGIAVGSPLDGGEVSFVDSIRAVWLVSES